MMAILSYMRWLSSDVPTGVSIPGRGFKKIKPQRQPSFEEGKVLYTQHCASCHQANGAGLRQADGRVLFPPLWGPGSFNLGAGMARLNTAAAFIKHNMPQGQEGSLEDQQAYDIAAYIIHRARPDFGNKHLDWPNGGKPEDARY
jgi:thiosulfate dehydrogenase